jgi:hypothetical protein
VLAAILIAATWYGAWTSKMLTVASKQQESQKFEQDAQSTFSLVMHHIALGESSPRGMYLEGKPAKPLVDSLGASSVSRLELAFDDRCYQGVGDVRFSIQDENGLIGVNFFSKPQLGTLLSLMGVAIEEQGPLIDKLEDYIDSDNLLRLNGAEEKQYERAGKKGPANALLLNANELYNVLEWNTIPDLWEKSDFSRLITVASMGTPNFNTAPKLALMTVATINESLAATIVEKRRQRGYDSLSALEAAIGQPLGLDPLGLGFYPGHYLRISLWHPAMSVMREIHVNLTPIAEKQQPWFIDYEITVPVPAQNKLNSCEPVAEIFSH